MLDVTRPDPNYSTAVTAATTQVGYLAHSSSSSVHETAQVIILMLFPTVILQTPKVSMGKCQYYKVLRSHPINIGQKNPSQVWGDNVGRFY